MGKRKMSTFERLRSGKMNRKERREWQQRLSAENSGLEVVHPDAAGIDVGNASHFVAVPPDRDELPVREFGSWTADLRRMAEWLKRCGIHTVAMQSTVPSAIPASRASRSARERSGGFILKLLS